MWPWCAQIHASKRQRTMYSSFRCFFLFAFLSNPRAVSILAQSTGEFKEDVSVCHTPHLHLPLSTPEREGILGRGGSGVRSGEACARHRRRQRRAAHVIVVDQLVLLQVRLSHSVGPIGVHSASLGRLLDREKHLLVRVQLDASHGPHRAGRLSSDATQRWSSDATRPHERPSGRHRKQRKHQTSERLRRAG